MLFRCCANLYQMKMVEGPYIHFSSGNEIPVRVCVLYTSILCYEVKLYWFLVYTAEVGEVYLTALLSETPRSHALLKCSTCLSITVIISYLCNSLLQIVGNYINIHLLIFIRNVQITVKIYKSYL